MNKNIIKIITLLLCVLCLGGIYYNSSKSGTQSHKISRKVVSLLKNSKILNNPVVDKIHKKLKLGKNTDFIVRKYAHGLEFALLACFTSILIFSYGKKGLEALVYILFIILLAAVLDEFHQYFIPGRGSSVVDIIIDFIGGLCGTSIFYGIYYTYTKICYRRSAKIKSLQNKEENIVRWKVEFS